MKKRYRSGKFVIKLSKEIFKDIKPYCKRIMIGGSIRRKSLNPVDIDIVLIPKDKEKIIEKMRKKGKYLLGGEHESAWRINRVRVDLYYTNKEEWGATLLAYSSKKGAEIGLRMIAKKQGLKLNQHGLWKGEKKIAGKTEREIYKALGRRYKEPKER